MDVAVRTWKVGERQCYIYTPVNSDMMSTGFRDWLWEYETCECDGAAVVYL